MCLTKVERKYGVNIEELKAQNVSHTFDKIPKGLEKVICRNVVWNSTQSITVSKQIKVYGKLT